MCRWIGCPPIIIFFFFLFIIIFFFTTIFVDFFGHCGAIATSRRRVLRTSSCFVFFLPSFFFDFFFLPGFRLGLRRFDRDVAEQSNGIGLCFLVFFVCFFLFINETTCRSLMAANEWLRWYLQKKNIKKKRTKSKFCGAFGGNGNGRCGSQSKRDRFFFWKISVFEFHL